MKIAMVTLYDIGSYGGTTKVICDMSNELVNRSHEVGIFYFSEKVKSIPYTLDKKVIMENCCVGLVDRFLRNVFIAKVLGVFSLGRKNRRISRCRWDSRNKSKAFGLKLEKFNPDIVISFSQMTTYMLMADLQLKAPVITMLHSNPEAYFKRLEFNLFKPYLERCAAIQVLMPEYKRIVQHFLNARHIEYIPNVVPQYGDIKDLRLPVIVCVGRVAPVKRQHLLVEAFALISSKYPEWRVELWGSADGEYAEKLRILIEKRHLTGVVSMKGNTNDVKNKLLKASIFVLTSEREGFSLALGEAMSMGLPAIGCKSCSSINSMIRNGENGYLCSDAPEDIATSIERLIKDPLKRKQMGERAKADMVQYSSDRVYEKWERLFYKVKMFDC